MDWNVIATTHEHHYRQAKSTLRCFGVVHETDYFNVLVMKVGSLTEFLRAFSLAYHNDEALRQSLARVLPVNMGFDFPSPAEFENNTKRQIEPWLCSFAGKTFHVRMHRRGFKGILSSLHEEQFLDLHIRDRLIERGKSAFISFEDPDMIVAVETVDPEAGMSLWTREERRRYPFLKLD